MSRSLNKAMIIGNLGADPEIRSTSSGTAVATLSVATSRRWTSRSGEEQERTEWHRVVCWDRLAEICERYLSKGDRVYVEGRIEYRQWEDRDGRTRYTTEIRCRDMVMLGSPGDVPRGRPSRPAPDRGSGDGGGEAEAEADTGEGGEDEDYSDFSNEALMGDDDLPF